MKNDRLWRLTAALLTMFIIQSVRAQVILVKTEPPPLLSPTSIEAGESNSGAKLDLWTSKIAVLLREAGVDARLEDEEILLSAGSRSAIILPHAECLTDAQIQALQEHVNQGYGLWITSGTGYRDATGSPRGFGFLEEILGGKIETTRFQAETTAALHMRFGKPGSCQIPPGYYLRLALTENPPCLTGGDPKDVVGYWTWDSFKEIPSDSIPRDPGMIARTLPSGGRVVWMGAGVEQFHLDPVNRKMALSLIGEVVRWLDGEGLPAVEAWPEGRECAVLIHGDIEDQFQAVKRLTDIIKKLRLPATYSILTREAVKYPLAVEAILETDCEIAVHGDNHAIFAGQSYDVQMGRLQNAAGFVALYGPRPTTFRPPELSYDETTLRAAKASGYTTFLACNHPDRDYPICDPDDRSAEGGLVMFPKSELDDYDLFERLKVVGEAAKVHTLVDDFIRIRDVGGLYKLNYHSQYLATDELPTVLESALTEIRGYKSVWFADSRDISEWVRSRSRVHLKSVSTADVVRVSLTNNSSEPIRGLVLRALPPRKVPAELLVPREVSQNCEYDVREGVLYAKIPLLKPGAIFEMELASSKGRALSSLNKKTVFTALKVAFAVGGVFILWFVMYLAFSGGKVRRVSVRSFGGGQVVEDDVIYRKLGLKPVPQTPAPPKSFFPVIPPAAASISVSNPARRTSADFQQHPAFFAEPVTPATPEPRVRETNPVQIPSSKLQTPNSKLVSKVPSLPLMGLHLTGSAKRSPQMTRRVGRASEPDRMALSGSKARPAPSAPVVTTNLPRVEAVLDNLPESLMDESTVFSLLSAETTPVSPSPVSRPGGLAPPPQGNLKSLYRSPSDSRTTANPPQAGRQSDRRAPSGQPPNAAKPRPTPKPASTNTLQQTSLVRTSIDMIRRHQARVTGGKDEWR